MTERESIRQHYGTTSLLETIDAALAQAGLDSEALDWADLAGLDQFHVGGLVASEALASRVRFSPDSRVLDVGCGLGGPARMLAGRYGCHVTGIDLNAPFIEAAWALSARTGLGERTGFIEADATALPFADSQFDIVWTQHVAMNIPDRDALYGELARMLRPGGQLAIYDPIQGPGGPVQFPVPWARTASDSRLLTASEMRDVLSAAGFEIEFEANLTETALAWFASRRAVPPSPLGIQVAMGDDFPQMVANLGRNVAEGRVELMQIIATRR